MDNSAVPSDLGNRIRAYRRDRGWTLARLAEATGVAISTLSKIEHGKMSPTYDKLVQLSRGMGVDLAALFGAAPPAGSGEWPWAVTRRGEGHPLSTRNYDYRYLAATQSGKRIIPSLGRVKARSLAEFGPLLRHPGEEFVFVLSGRIEIHLEGEPPFVITTGDSLWFDSNRGHAYLSLSDELADILVVNTGTATENGTGS